MLTRLLKGTKQSVTVFKSSVNLVDLLRATDLRFNFISSRIINTHVTSKLLLFDEKDVRSGSPWGMKSDGFDSQRTLVK